MNKFNINSSKNKSNDYITKSSCASTNTKVIIEVMEIVESDGVLFMELLKTVRTVKKDGLDKFIRTPCLHNAPEYYQGYILRHLPYSRINFLISNLTKILMTSAVFRQIKWNVLWYRGCNQTNPPHVRRVVTLYEKSYHQSKTHVKNKVLNSTKIYFKVFNFV